MADLNVVDSTKIKALGMGINISDLIKKIPELEARCNRKIEAAEDFKNDIQVVALSTGILPGVLSEYITSRCTDTVKKKSRSAGQLSLLFEEIQ